MLITKIVFVIKADVITPTWNIIKEIMSWIKGGWTFASHSIKEYVVFNFTIKKKIKKLNNNELCLFLWSLRPDNTLGSKINSEDASISNIKLIFEKLDECGLITLNRNRKTNQTIYIEMEFIEIYNHDKIKKFAEKLNLKRENSANCETLFDKLRHL